MTVVATPTEVRVKAHPLLVAAAQLWVACLQALTGDHPSARSTLGVVVAGVALVLASNRRGS